MILIQITAGWDTVVLFQMEPTTGSYSVWLPVMGLCFHHHQLEKEVSLMSAALTCGCKDKNSGGSITLCPLSRMIVFDSPTGSMP